MDVTIEMTGEWGGGSVALVLAGEVWGPKFRSSAPMLKLGLVTFIRNLSMGEAEKRRSVDLTGQLVQPDWWLQVKLVILSQKQ